MFGRLFQPKYKATALFPDGIDMHTHILWGVDDGASCLEESLTIIRCLKSKGLKGAYCTPHIMSQYPDNTPDSLRRRFDQLLADTKGEDFQLRLAAEYMLDEQFDEQLRHYQPLTYDGTHLLIELPQYYLPGAWKDKISAIRDKGYIPVLAHPERYGRVLHREDFFRLSQQEDVKYQGNVGSLKGIYGKSVTALAKDFYTHHLYDWWGTDSHTASMANNMPLKA